MIPITTRAEHQPGSRIVTVDASGCGKIRHVLPATPCVWPVVLPMTVLD